MLLAIKAPTSHNATGALLISYVATNITPTGVYEYYFYFDNGPSVISNVGPVFSVGAIIELYPLDGRTYFKCSFPGSMSLVVFMVSMSKYEMYIDVSTLSRKTSSTSFVIVSVLAFCYQN